MFVKVVGIQKGVSKTNNQPYTVVHAIGEFETYQNGSGQRVENQYIKGNLDVALGEDVEWIYGVGFGGKAVVTGIKKREGKTA